MNETTKKTLLAIVVRLFRWVFLIIGAIATFTAGEFLFVRLTEHSVPADKTLYALVNLIAIAFCLWLLSPILRRVFPPFVRLTRHFFRWLFTWRTMRRILISLAILATLIAAFYTEEDWRGKRAWENCKRELEAKGDGAGLERIHSAVRAGRPEFFHGTEDARMVSGQRDEGFVQTTGES